MGLGTEFPLFQNLQGVELTPDEVCARLESLHRMHDQVEIVKLPMPSRRLKEVSRKTSRGIVENRRKLCQRNGRRLIERSVEPRRRITSSIVSFGCSSSGRRGRRTASPVRTE